MKRIASLQELLLFWKFPTGPGGCGQKKFLTMGRWVSVGIGFQSYNWFPDSYTWNYWEYVVQAIFYWQHSWQLSEIAQSDSLLLVQMLLNRGFAGPRPAKGKGWSSQELRDSILNTVQLTEPLTSPPVKHCEQKVSIVTAWLEQKPNENVHTHYKTTLEKIRFGGTSLVFRWL